VGRQSLGGSVTSAPRVEPHPAPSPTTSQQRPNCVAHRAQIGHRSRVARFHQPADAGPFAGPCRAGGAWPPRGHVGSGQPGQHGAATRGALDGSHGHREASARRTWDVSPSVEASPAHPGSNPTQRRHHQPANSGRIAWHIALKLVIVRAWHASTSQLTLGRSPGVGWPGVAAARTCRLRSATPIRGGSEGSVGRKSRAPSGGSQANVGRQSLGGSVTSAPRVEPHPAPSPTTSQQRPKSVAHRAQNGRRSRVARCHQPADAGPFAGP